MDNTDNGATGMTLFKQLIERERQGKSMSEEEREWFEYTKKKSEKYGGMVRGSSPNRDATYGSD